MLYAKISLSLLLSLGLVFSGCAHRPEDSARAAAQEKSLRQPQTLTQNYRIIVVEPVAISVEMANQYPQAARSCQRSAIAALKSREAFQLVHHTAPEKPAAPVLLVRGRITDLRLTSRMNRLWPGSAQDSSYINMDVQLVDASTKTILQEKQLSTISAVPVASGAAKSGESDITQAMGALVGEYVFAVMPAKKH